MKSAASTKIRRGLFIFACFLAFSGTVYAVGAMRASADITSPQQLLMKVSQMIQYGNALAAGLDEKDITDRFRAVPRKACVADCDYRVISSGTVAGKAVGARQKWLVVAGVTADVCRAVAQVDPRAAVAACLTDSSGAHFFVHWLKA
jgi:hypothetical protein